MLDRENKEFETSNTLDVKYVDTKKKQKYPLLVPLLVMFASLILFFLYPFQIIGLVGSIGFMLYLSQKTEAILPRALVATGILLSILGLILGIAGLDEDINPTNILRNIQTADTFTCEGLVLEQNESCYADDAVHLFLTSSQTVNEVNIQIIGTEEIYSKDRIARIKPEEREQILFAYNVSYYGEPTVVTVVPSVYGEDDETLECFESTIIFEIDECE